jgi:hypothetical protein
MGFFPSVDWKNNNRLFPLGTDSRIFGMGFLGFRVCTTWENRKI